MGNYRHTAIDLFSGCGGLTLGLRSARIDVLAGIENDPLACRTYKLNHPNTIVLQQDIRKIRPRFLLRRLGLSPGELSLVAGCPPCQGFSSLRTLNGKLKVDEPMNDLVFQFIKFIKVFLPRAILMENVPGLIDDSRLKVFKDKISTLGYQSSVKVLDAADYGTPQRRQRMVLIAIQGQKPEFGQMPKYRKTVRWALRWLESPENSKDSLHNYQVHRTPHVEEIIRHIPINGGSRTSLPEELQLECHKKFNGFRDIYGRMHWHKPSPTITGGCINPSKGRFLHPEEHRAVTLREAAILQGFPKTYQFDLSRGRHLAAQMIGNAFPPRFAETHAKAILRNITSGAEIK